MILWLIHIDTMLKHQEKAGVDWAMNLIQTPWRIEGYGWKGEYVLKVAISHWVFGDEDW